MIWRRHLPRGRRYFGTAFRDKFTSRDTPFREIEITFMPFKRDRRSCDFEDVV